MTAWVYLPRAQSWFGYDDHDDNDENGESSNCKGVIYQNCRTARDSVLQYYYLVNIFYRNTFERRQLQKKTENIICNWSIWKSRLSRIWNGMAWTIKKLKTVFK